VKRLFLMCGIAFSGKTTVTKQLTQALGCAYVSLDDINAERCLHGGGGIGVEEWERTHAVALERIKELMTRCEDIVLDDTNCFRWLRDRYREFAQENGYIAEVVYLDVPLQEVQARMVQNSITASRHSIEANIFDEHVRGFEPPQAGEVATVLRNPEEVSRWIELRACTKPRMCQRRTEG
jgi:predicted kinase